MKITITGASGFVGINLHKYLKHAHMINNMSVRYLPNQIFEIKTDAFIHLAGKAHDLKKSSSPNDYYEANFELTKQLFDAFLVSEASIFIFMSTVKAAADDLDVILTEDYIPNPKTHYGIAKHQAEQYLLNKEVPKSKRVYILRPCMIHGPGNKGNLNLLYKIVKNKIPWTLGAFDNQRSFLSIENLCFIIEELLENSAIRSGIYNIADDQTLSTNELIRLLGSSLGFQTNIWKINSHFIKSIAKVGDYLNLPLNSERLQKLTSNYSVSNEKILKAIKKPLPVSAKEGLMTTFNSFKINKI